jgi:hypothetical protein
MEHNTLQKSVYTANSMKEEPSWKATSRPAFQKITEDTASLLFILYAAVMLLTLW